MSIVHDGRPDFIHLAPHGGVSWGCTRVTPKLPYVYSTRGFLVHRVRDMNLMWWETIDRGAKLRRLDPPKVSYRTVCGQHLLGDGAHTSATLCAVPRENAEMCGRCQGREPTFTGKDAPERKDCSKRLGCAVPPADHNSPGEDA